MPESGNAPYLDFINNAKGYIYVNIYFMDYKPVIDALEEAQDAHKVKVFVLIDGHPFGLSSYLVNKEKTMLQEANLTTGESPSWFRFDHAKYMVSSNEVLISTANTDPSAFEKNREYVFVSNDPALITSLTNVFTVDFTGKQETVEVSKNLVLSPTNSTANILMALSQNGPVYSESEELSDDPDVMNAFESKGNQAYLILPSTISQSNKENALTLMQHGVHVKLMNKDVLYMHAKIIVGSNYFFMGSENYSTTSLTDNREVGIIMNSSQDSNDAKLLYNTFHTDWNNSVDLLN
jgi:cardiolipin synthase